LVARQELLVFEQENSGIGGRRTVSNQLEKEKQLLEEYEKDYQEHMHE
jgi:hypothetical protein